MATEKEPAINITMETVGRDPSIAIFHVELLGKTGMWTETFGSIGELHSFLRGVEAGTSMPELHGMRYEIPR